MCFHKKYIVGTLEWGTSDEYPQHVSGRKRKNWLITCIFIKNRYIYILCIHCQTIEKIIANLSGSVGCVSNWRPGGRSFDPRQGRQHSFVVIDHKIFSTVILSLPLIQEEQLSVSGERMCTILINRLED